MSEKEDVQGEMTIDIRQAWRCQVCKQPNRILAGGCEYCEQDRGFKTIIRLIIQR